MTSGNPIKMRTIVGALREDVAGDVADEEVGVDIGG